MCKRRKKNCCQPQTSVIDKIVTIASVPVVALIAVPTLIVQTVLD